MSLLRVMDVGELPKKITRYGKRWSFTLYFFNRKESDAGDKIRSLKKHNPNYVFIKVPYILTTYEVRGSRKVVDVKWYAIYERCEK